MVGTLTPTSARALQVHIESMRPSARIKVYHALHAHQVHLNQVRELTMIVTIARRDITQMQARRTATRAIRGRLRRRKPHPIARTAREDTLNMDLARKFALLAVKVTRRT